MQEFVAHKNPSYITGASVFFILSILSYFVKYQAILVTIAISLFILDNRSSGSVRYKGVRLLILNALGALIAVTVVILLSGASANVVGTKLNAVSGNFIGNIVRIAQGNSPDSWQIQRLYFVAFSICVKYAAPLCVLVWFVALRSRKAFSDPLLLLSIYLTIAVGLFNLIVFKMPGAGTYYMIQAGAPLGYMVARGVVSMLRGYRATPTISVILLLLALNATLNFQPGSSADRQRWGTGFSELTDKKNTNSYDLVAARLSTELAPNQVLLMDGWNYQSRILPFLLRRADGYGFLFDMPKTNLVEMLQRDDGGNIGAIAFFGRDLLARFNSSDWSAARALVSRSFVRASGLDGGDWAIYLPTKGSVEKLFEGVGRDIDFSQKECSALLIDGWSRQEDWGVWSDGPRAVLWLPAKMDGRQVIGVSLRFSVFVNEKHPWQNISIYANMELLLEHIYYSYSGNSAELSFSNKLRAAAAKSGRFELNINLPELGKCKVTWLRD